VNRPVSVKPAASVILVREDGASHELHEASESERKKIDSSAQLLGYLLGDALYEAYLKGRVSRSMVRQLFLAHLEEPGIAKEAFREIAARVRCDAKKLPASVTR